MKPTLALALLSLAAGSASASVIVDYKMTAFGSALTATSTGAAYSSDTNVTITSLVNQSGVFTSGSDNYNSGTDRVSIWSTATGSATNYANAFTAGSFITFQITANAGYDVSFSSITFQVAAATAGPSDRAFYLVSETNTANFSASSTVLSTDRTSAGGGLIPYQAATSTNTVPQDYTVDLSSLGGLAAGETRYFRFYLQTPNAVQGIAFDDIVVNGTVSVSAVPEPSTYALLAGCALLGFTLHKRRNPRPACI